MYSKEFLGQVFYQQGYNYRELVPTGETKLGGGCQASSLLMGIRLMSGNTNLSMDLVAERAKELELVFFDRGFADRLSYVAIPLVAASLLPEHLVTTMHAKAQENIGDESANVFGRETNKRYGNMHTTSNLVPIFSVNPYYQVRKMVSVVEKGGIAIPLVHPNTLFQNDNPDTQGFLHAVVLTNFDSATQTFSVIDANPGFSSIPNFSRRKEEGKIKIPSDRIHTLEMADRVASRFHPKKSVIYEVSASQLEKALRTVSTTISA